MKSILAQIGLLLVVLAALVNISLVIANDTITGNRYGYKVLYHSEISSAEAWQKTSTKVPRSQLQPVILDVRRVEEYVAGHPPGAISIPFPHVHRSPTQPNDGNALFDGSDAYIGYDISEDPEDVGFQITPELRDGVRPIAEFTDYVAKVIPNKNTPIYLVCATGYRSVQAGNALAKAGFTQVRNVWEGWTGLYKYAYDRAQELPTITEDGKFIALDVNNDGKVDVNDKDGWAYYQDLPVSTLIKAKLIDKRFTDLYSSELKKLNSQNHYDKNKRLLTLPSVSAIGSKFQVLLQQTGNSSDDLGVGDVLELQDSDHPLPGLDLEDTAVFDTSTGLVSIDNIRVANKQLRAVLKQINALPLRFEVTEITRP